MSDFTYGNLIRSENKELAKQYLAPDAYLINLNSKWVCMLSEDDKYFTEISDKTFSDNILELSTHIPILFFAHPEDHGFGYAILKDKKKISTLYVNYESDSWESIFSDINTENFKLFGYSDSQIKALDDLLADANCEENMWNISDSFMEILELEQMSFVSWDYISRDEEDGEDIFTIIAKG